MSSKPLTVQALAGLGAVVQQRQQGRRVQRNNRQPEREQNNRPPAEYRDVSEQDVQVAIAEMTADEQEVYIALVACGVTRRADGKAPWTPFYDVASASGVEKPTATLRILAAKGHVAEMRRAQLPTFIAKAFFTGDQTVKARRANVDARTSAIMRKLHGDAGTGTEG